MFTLISNPYAKAKPRFVPYSVAKPMFWLSIALYLVALALPVGSGRFGQPGFLALTYGLFFCLNAPWLLAGWLANGVYWLAVVFVAKRRWQLAAYLGGAASCMALSVLLVDGFSRQNLGDWGPGYWSWSGSMMLLTCAAVLLAGVSGEQGDQKRTS